MIVIDPVTLGDVAFSRPSPKWVFDRTGTLVEVPPNTLGVTYDPSDLSKAPYALIEPEATNYIRNNTMQGASVGLPGIQPTNWVIPNLYQGLAREIVGAGVDSGIEYIDVRFSGTVAGSGTTFIFFGPNEHNPAAVGQTWALSAFLKVIRGTPSPVRGLMLQLDERGATSRLSETFSERLIMDDRPFSACRLSMVRTLAQAGTTMINGSVRFGTDGSDIGRYMDFTLRIGLPQLERDRVTSPIKTSGSAVTRAADVIGNTAGLLHSNVPITEPAYDVAATYAKDAAVYDPATKLVYWSMLDANKGNPLSDPSKWNKRGATNRWAAFDDRNNTQSTSAEELLFVLSPRAIAQGLFLGNVDGSEVRVSMAVPNFGVVYSETRSLIMSTSNSSFFRWGFNRIRRKTSFLSLKLPNFYNGLVTIVIRRPGGVAKCGMCMIGPTVDPGPTLVGLSTEIRDYSTTLFNTDGSSETTQRGYRKLMSLDVVIDTENIEAAEDQIIAWRQKTAVWIGAASRPDSIICGRYSSFKKVIESYPQSKMALQIEGVLS